MSTAELIQAAFMTLRDPHAGAHRVIGLEMDRRQRWEILLLIVVLSTVLGFLSLSLSLGAEVTGVGFSPFSLGVSQGVVLLSMVLAMQFVGQAVGGRGRLDDAILLVAWLQFALICLQVLQLIATVVLPILAVLIGLMGVVLAFRMLTVFTKELHQFNSTPRVFIAVLVVSIVVVMSLQSVFDAFGLNIFGAL